MLNTLKILPCPLLQSFVSCYFFREFDTQGMNLIRPWFADPEVSLAFFLKDKQALLINEETGQVVNGGASMAFTGVATQFNGKMIFNGRYTILTICFKPNGFYKIFRFPLNEVINKLFDADEIFCIQSKMVYEQLVNAKDIQEIANQTDKFLLYFLRKQKLVELNDNITVISNIMSQRAGVVSVEKFANEANMSIRNFERRFSQNIGISPKLYCRIIRFNYALELKQKNPTKDWTTIAYESGYFDQMHLIRDFKEFAGSSPKNFMNQTPPVTENITLVKR
jgi:AraC-like DNA-binding protein